MRRPLSLQQQALLEASGFQRCALSDKATLSITLRVRGELDRERLAHAVAQLVSRHEVLRTRLVAAHEGGRYGAHGHVLDRGAAPVVSTLPLFDEREIDAIGAWSLRHRSTLSTTLLVAFARAVRADARGDDLVVSTIFEQRDHPAARHTLGIFLVGALIRLRVREGEPMPVLVDQARATVLAAYQHAQIPVRDYARFAPRLVPGILGLSPAWLRFFQYVPSVAGEVRFGAARAEIVHTSGKMDPRDMIGLHLGVFHGEDGRLHGRFSYDEHDLDGERARCVLEDFRDYALEVVQ